MSPPGLQLGLAPGPPQNFTQTVRHDIYPAISPTEFLMDAAKGVTVLITGAGRGVGRAQALAFAHAGAAKIILLARSEDELAEVEGAIHEQTSGATEVLRIRADVTNEEDIKKAVELAGEVHVLLNNAGVMGQWNLVHDINLEEWWKPYEVHVKGTYLVTREVLLRALAIDHRPVNLTIINTVSVGAANTIPGYSSYSTSKTALSRFTEFLHFEYANLGIRVFEFHPGGIRTRLVQEAVLPELLPIFIDTPELPAGFSLWLATQGLKVDFLRGRYTSANWDVEELLAREDEIRTKDLLWTRVVGQELEMPK